MAHQPRKRFGQHFLHDPNIIAKIVNAIAPTESDHLVEIGPGQGAMTKPLLEKCGKLDVIELDRDLVAALWAACEYPDKLTIHDADALKFDICALRQDDENKLRVVGNLPYNISTPLIFHLIKQIGCIKDMYFMLQKEVIDRIVAKPGSKTYGRLSVMVQYYCQCERLFNIGPGAFSPPPKVDSSVIALQPYTTPPVDVESVQALSLVVAQAFSQRRKTIRNALKTLLTQEQITEANVDPSQRPEQLSLSDFAHLANQYSQSTR